MVFKAVNYPNDPLINLALDKYFLSSIMEKISRITLLSNIKSKSLSFILMAWWVTSEANRASTRGLLECPKMKIKSKILCRKWLG